MRRVERPALRVVRICSPCWVEMAGGVELLFFA
jgi:hypothetical protein